MCIAPSTLDDGTFVICRECWQCLENRKNDLIGRCIAEQQVSTYTLALTLTYRDSEDASTAVLNIRDFQKFIKRLRKGTLTRPPFNVRYIVAGEYGSKKGRAHWHVILFFDGEYPEIEQSKFNAEQQNWDEVWPHGYVYFQKPDYSGFAYLLKYVLKDVDQDVQQTALSMSKYPPLGTEYFINEAERYVENKLSPQNFVYSFAQCKTNKGKVRKFWLVNKTREIFLVRFIKYWEELHEKPYPFSELVHQFEMKNGDLFYVGEEPEITETEALKQTWFDPRKAQEIEFDDYAYKAGKITNVIDIDLDTKIVVYENTVLELKAEGCGGWQTNLTEIGALLDRMQEAGTLRRSRNEIETRLRQALRLPETDWLATLSVEETPAEQCLPPSKFQQMWYRPQRAR